MTNLEKFREMILDTVKDPAGAAKVMNDPEILTLIIGSESCRMCRPQDREWCVCDLENDVFPSMETCLLCIEWWMKQEVDA